MGGCGVSANKYSCAHGAQINFGYLTPYLTYGPSQWAASCFAQFFLLTVKRIVIRAVQARSVKGTVLQAFFIIFLTAWNLITEFASVNIG